jgi:hypothetical protein
VRIQDNRSDDLGTKDFREPTEAEIAAIEREMPLIEAEVKLLDAEIRLMAAVDKGEPSPLDWRRVRRAETGLARVAAGLFSRPVQLTATVVSFPRIESMGGAA